MIVPPGLYACACTPVEICMQSTGDAAGPTPCTCGTPETCSVLLHAQAIMTRRRACLLALLGIMAALATASAFAQGTDLDVYVCM